MKAALDFAITTLVAATAIILIGIFVIVVAAITTKLGLGLVSLLRLYP